MRILPVIDLMNGLVVRGIGGRRDEYRPIVSQLVDSAQPAAIAEAFAGVGFREAYVADLDAIGGGQPAWDIYEQLIEAGLRLWIDAGLADVDRASKLAAFHAADDLTPSIVAGLESVACLADLSQILAAVGQERLVFSLDLRNGQPLSNSLGWSGMSPEQIATAAVQISVRRFIVLDLAGVGEDRGVSTLALCRRLRQMNADLEITSGGGVRGAGDLQALADAGCNAALVASALHDGRVTGPDW